jgi:PmbA protein
MNIETLTDEARAILKKSGARQWEVLVARSRGLDIGVRGAEVDKFQQYDSIGLAVRLVKDDRLGFSYALGQGAGGVARAVQAALAAARSADPEPELSLAGPTGTPASDLELFDGSLAVEPLEAKIDRARVLVDAAKAADPRVRHVHPAEVGETVGESILVTSLGLEQRQRTTRVSALVTAVAEGDGAQEEGWKSCSRRFWADLDLTEVGRTAGRKAADFLGAGPVADGRWEVILTSEVAADFLYLLATSLLGDNLVKGRSLLAGRLDEQPLSPLVTVVDDGLLPRGLGSAHFDDEGTPQGAKTLIEGGVVKDFVFDRLWGARRGVASTGNAVRGSLKTPPVVGFTNLYLEPGQGALGDVAAELERGLVVSAILGGHTADPVSGQFSFGAAGHLIEHGRLTRAVKGIALAGHLLELFSAVRALSGDLAFHGRIGAPSVLVSGVSVSGP